MEKIEAEEQLRQNELEKQEKERSEKLERLRKEWDDEEKAKKKAEKDKFYSIIGSKNDIINKCLSNKPKSMKDLVKAAKLSGNFYDHLSSLAKRKLIEKTEKGFILIGK